MQMFKLSADAIDPGPLLVELENSAAGACVTFEGWVRNHNDGRAVTLLEYEGYEEVATKEGRTIVEEAVSKFMLMGARCVHRVGRLEIGDMAVWVGVTGGHREEAFDGCRYIIEEVKHRLPIWKKEHYASGDSGWVNCETARAHG